MRGTKNAPDPTAENTARQEVIATERAWVQAIRDADTATLAEMMTDVYAVIMLVN